MRGTVFLAILVGCALLTARAYTMDMELPSEPENQDPIPADEWLEPETTDPFERLKIKPPIPQEKDVAGLLPKRLHLFSLHTRETVDVVFWREGHYVLEGLNRLNYFLRDHRSGEVIDMDPRLFSLIHRLYRDVGAKGPIHIISGYRSAKTNAMLSRAGRNVATRSQHILGKAMDIRIPGVPLHVVRNTVLAYGQGGVGYYVGSDFVHVDTGRPRYW